jgi:AcrR family transcriptional regulator
MKTGDPVSERLLAVARDLFPRRGYEGTSVREITSRARANLGAVTYHFGSKRRLYYAAVESLAEPLASRIAAGAQSPGTPLERIGHMVREFLEHVAVHPGAPTLLLRELASDRPIPPPIASVMQRNLAAMTRTIAAGQREGSIRSGDPRLLVLSIASHPFYLAVAGRLLKDALGVDFRDPATRTRIIDQVVDTIRRSLAKDAKVSP